MNTDASAVEEMIPKAGTPRLVEPPERRREQPVLGRGQRHLGADHRPAVQRTEAGDDHQRRHHVAGPRAAEDLVDGGGERRGRLRQRRRRDDAEDGGEREQVDDGGAERAEDGRLAGRSCRGRAPCRRHRRGLDAEVAEQAQGHGPEDRADRALAADVPDLEVGAAHEEQPDRGHEDQRDELQDRRPQLHGAHGLDADEVDRGGSHSPISARTIENSLFWPVLTNSST